MTYRLAKAAYEAWRKSLGYITPDERFHRPPGLPDFEDLSEPFQEAWEDVASAIVKERSGNERPFKN